MTAPEPEQFHIEIPDAALADLRHRLESTRWPDDPGNEDWRYGTPVGFLRSLVEYWLDEYDWRRHEAEMNRFDHYRVTLDGVQLHFLRRLGSGPSPVPLLLSHGWPWTFWDYSKMIEPLAEPPSPDDSFDVVVPSLPGFGFSSPLRDTGVGIGRTAQLWRRLMCDVLGHERFGAQGNDFGAVITQRLAQEHPEVLVGVHMSRYKRPTGTAAVGAVTVSESDYGPDEAGDYQRNQNGLALAASHIAVHTRDPMSLAAGLNDSPVGLAAWLLERRRAWSDCDGDLKKVYTCDDLITTLCLYWFTGTISSSLRLYWEAAHESPAPSPTTGKVITVPTAVGVLPRDVMAMPRKHAEQDTDLRQWTRYPRGGHFGPAEVPELIVEDLRAFFRPLR